MTQNKTLRIKEYSMVLSSVEFVCAVAVGWVIVFLISRIPRDRVEDNKQEDKVNLIYLISHYLEKLKK